MDENWGYPHDLGYPKMAMCNEKNALFVPVIERHQVIWPLQWKNAGTASIEAIMSR